MTNDLDLTMRSICLDVYLADCLNTSAELDRLSCELEINEQLHKIKEDIPEAPDCAEPVYWRAVEYFHIAMVKALNEIHNSSIALQITEAMGAFIDEKTKEFEEYLEAVR